MLSLLIPTVKHQIMYIYYTILTCIRKMNVLSFTRKLNKTK